MLGAGLQQDRLHRGRLSTCLAQLDQLTAEIQLHATAVRLGRLSATAASSASRQLIAPRPAGQRGGGTSFREGKGMAVAASTRLQKYRGSKTDTCLVGGGRKVERQGRRKSSVIEQLSTFLKTGLKI